jgi:arylsulfatase A-like enzyme
MIVCADKANQLIMKKRGAFFLAFTSVIGLGFHSGPNTPARPNIIFMLADDLGWADLGCYGNTFHETPNLDKLAKEGMQFTRAYSACAVCSPTRASIMTGKYPARLKITDWIPGVVYPYAKLTTSRMRYELPLEEEILPEILHKNGYATYHVGKWHLGETEEFWPHNRGFDVNIGGHSKGQPGSYFYPYKNVTPTADYSVKFLPEGGKEGDYLTDFLTDHALKLMEKGAQSGKPFFLNMSYYQVHTPLQGKPDYIQKYEEKKKRLGLTKQNTTYAAMIQSLDESVGRIMNKLEELGLRENTIVIFSSDNGGLVEVDGNAPLREGKGFYYEGGIRVPLLVRYPTFTKPRTQNESSVCSIDFVPTLLEMTQLPKKKDVDGLSFASVLKGSDAYSMAKKRDLYWHYPHYHTPQRPPTGAILSGDYKLLERFEDGRLELYNVKTDVSETYDLAQEQPERVQKMLKKLKSWQKETGALMPVPNPNYDSEKPFRNSVTAWKGENRL